MHEAVSKLAVKQIVVGNDLLEGLADSLKAIGNKPGIIFCNYKDTINGISDFLKQRKISQLHVSWNSIFDLSHIGLHSI